MGKIIGGLTFVGGAIVIRSLMRPEINGLLMLIGAVILMAALVLFIRELSRI